MGDPYDLAHVGKIIAINGELAKVDIGGDTIISASVGLVDAKVGDFVLVHAGYAICIMDMKKARQTLNEWGKETV
ncbi:MAG TPA: HypC/HybG/HupF family hydrogenase formation chaperone [Candidatus Bathyarchaeia archaeon]|nr:HypC/HybG/HupF family hydrogenase formation chaperone [Candidatus Bathyarchaeia archaeon]